MSKIFIFRLVNSYCSFFKVIILTLIKFTDLTKSKCRVLAHSYCQKISLIAGSLEAAYSLNWGAREIWGKGGGETLALL